MSSTRSLLFAATAVVLASDGVLAQVTTHPPPSVAPPPLDASIAGAPAPMEAKEETWSILASAYTYIVPDSRDYVQPTVLADRGVLHLEARYNYEGPDSGSVWLGYNFHVGDELALDFTPMIGGVFGDTAGVAPGYRLALSYWKLELATEGEYLVDSRDSSSNYFYNWSELSLYPAAWMRAGLALQRTKLYQTDFDVQRGFLLGFNYEALDFTGYLFNPTASQPTVVLALGLSF